MSDPKAFMRIERANAKYRPVHERIQDFRDISVDPPQDLVREQAKRCMDCGVPFCQGDTGCPLGNRIPEWNVLAEQGRWAEALQSLHATNNFPEFTSRLCPAPCEAACVLGLHSEAVTIKSIERSIIDRGFELGLIRPIPARRRTGRRVAIVGSGPAGLAAAQELARRGHTVTVFEKAARPGGLLRYGIPDFKMEKDQVERRLSQLEAEGVTFKTSVTIGRDITLADLRCEHDAVAIAIGAEVPRDLTIPGRTLDGIHFAMDYLVAQNRLIGEEPTPSIDARGKRVVVVGGGDTGSDCIGTAHRQGALSVHQLEIQGRPPLERSEATPWPHWPLMLRTSHAHEEGASREWSIATRAFRGVNGHVTALLAERVSDGRPVEIAADLVLLAMGFTGPAPELLEGLERTTEGRVRTDHGFMTSLPGVFIAGDARRGASLIVWAIAEGRRMAAGIDRYLSTAKQKFIES